jgi:hypothetical protein
VDPIVNLRVAYLIEMYLHRASADRDAISRPIPTHQHESPQLLGSTLGASRQLAHARDSS